MRTIRKNRSLPTSWATSCPLTTALQVIGGRFERTSPVTAVGNVFAFHGRHDDERMARLNPSVETGNIGSLLAGAQLFDTSGVVASRLRAEVEQGLSTMAGGEQARHLIEWLAEIVAIAQFRSTGM